MEVDLRSEKHAMAVDRSVDEPDGLGFINCADGNVRKGQEN